MKKKTIDDWRCILEKVLDRVKQIIGIEKYDNTKILLDTNDKFPEKITLKSVVVLKTCVIRYDDKFFPQLS